MTGITNMVKAAYIQELSPLIITCGITGDNNCKDINPGIPLTAEEQVRESLSAFNAGAVMVHIHRRSAANHSITSENPDEYMEVNTAVRAICPDIIINNTSGGSKKRTHDGSVSPPATASIAAKPEIASLDAVNLIAGGDAQLRLPPIGRPIDTHLTKSESDAVVAFMKENGCKPEYMCYGSGDFEYLNEFINAGLPGFDGPHWIQLVCTGNTIHAKIDSICKAIDSLPDNSILGIISGGDTQWGVLAAAITMGAHVRVGMEDNMYLANGEMADSNARLVEKIVRIARDIGRPIATPTQARDMLGLDKPRQYK